MKTAGAWISLCLIVLAGLAMALEREPTIVICDDKSSLICVEEEPDPRGALTWQEWLRLPHESTYLEHKVTQRGKDVAVMVYRAAWEPKTQLFWLRLDL